MKYEERKVGAPCPPCESAPSFLQSMQNTQPETPHISAVSDAAGPPAWPRKNKIGFTGLDSVFALVFLWIGWMFWELQAFRDWFPFDHAGVGTAIFCVIYTGAVLVYVWIAGVHPAKESWFWLAVVLCLGLAYALPYGGELLGALHYMMLLLAAQYWVLCVTGRLLKQGKTSNWLGFDLLNAAVILPWGNFMRLPVALWAGAKQLLQRRKNATDKVRKKEGRRRIFSVLGGVLAGLLCLCFVLPLLMQADDGFAFLLQGFTQQLSHFVKALLRPLDLGSFLSKCMFAVPTALFLYGTVYGCVRGRRTCIYRKEEICAGQRGIRVLSHITVTTALMVVCAAYVLFIAVQAKYLFGAFWGALPQGFSYAEYARQGFFELCRVAAINICILLAANVFSKNQMQENRLLRICNTAVSVLTLLLLATAASKMGLYILAYGLTVKRVLVSVFLVWLALVFGCIIVRQHKNFALVPLAVFVGSVLFALLCVLPVQQGIMAYNRTRVENGTLDVTMAQANSYLPFDGQPATAQKEEAAQAQNTFFIEVKNEAQEVYGLRFAYYAGGQQAGEQAVDGANGALFDGEEVTVSFEKEMFEQKNRNDFGLAVFVTGEDGSEVLLEDYWQWDAQMGRTYRFVLSGSEEEGFALKAVDDVSYNAWQYTRTPWNEMPQTMRPSRQISG